jgi:hypothetical protein
MGIATIVAHALTKMHTAMTSTHDNQYTDIPAGREMRFQMVE